MVANSSTEIVPLLSLSNMLKASWSSSLYCGVISRALKFKSETDYDQIHTMLSLFLGHFLT
jgi:hypothetical protein